MRISKTTVTLKLTQKIYSTKNDDDGIDEKYELKQIDLIMEPTEQILKDIQGKQRKEWEEVHVVCHLT